MKKRVILLLILVSVLLTACWDKKEFVTISFATAMALDKADNNYVVSLKVIMPKNASEGENNQPDWIIDGEGETLYKAMEDLNMRTPRDVYWGHMKVIILGKDVLQDDVVEILRALADLKDFNRDTAIVASDDEGVKLLEKVSELSNINNVYVYSLIEDIDKSYKNSLVSLNDVVVRSTYEKGCVYIPRLSYGESIMGRENDDNQKEILLIKDGFIFKDNKLFLKTDEDFTTGFRFVQNKINNVALVVNDKSENVSFNIKKMQSRYEFDEESEKFKVILTGEVNLAKNYVSKLDYEKMQYLQGIMNEEIKEEIEKSIRLAQSENADVFNMMQFLKSFNREYYKNNKRDFDELNIVVESRLKLMPNLVNE